MIPKQNPLEKGFQQETYCIKLLFYKFIYDMCIYNIYSYTIFMHIAVCLTLSSTIDRKFLAGIGCSLLSNPSLQSLVPFIVP